MIIRLLISSLLLTCAAVSDGAVTPTTASVTTNAAEPSNNDTAATQPSVTGSTVKVNISDSTEATSQLNNETDTGIANETTTTQPNTAPSDKPDNGTGSTTVAPTTTTNQTVSIAPTKAPGQTTEAPKGADNTTISGPVTTAITTQTTVNITVSTAKVNASTAKPPAASTVTTQNTTAAASSTTTPTMTTTTRNQSVTVVTDKSGSTDQTPVTTNNGTSEAPKVTVTNASVTAVTTSASPTTTPTTTAASTPQAQSSPKAPKPTQAPIQVKINEIMIDDKGMFQSIELQVNSPDLNVSNYVMVMVMVDGTGSKKLMTFRYLKNFITIQNNGLFMINFNTSSGDTLPSVQTKGTAVAIYQIDQMTSTTLDKDWTLTSEGLVDALVIGKKYEDISSSLVNMLTPTCVYPFVLDPSKYGGKRTISRCSSNMLLCTDMFALVNPSMGDDNKDKCDHRWDVSEPLALKFAAECGVLMNSNGSVKTKPKREVMRFVIKEVNSMCRCGLTMMHVNMPDAKVTCCGGGVSVAMQIGAPTEDQEKAFTKNYKQFIETASDIKLNKKSYKLDNSCTNDCCAVPRKQTSDDSSKNVRTTVAVIVTLLGIFMIIVVVVVIYMKRKKKAVYQFRMSRLEEEDDDMIVEGRHNYHDEFVGGQEATFDTNS